MATGDAPPPPHGGMIILMTTANCGCVPPVTMGNHPEGIAAAAIRVARRGLRVALRGRGDL
ncbi:hypothetical protein GCM10022255_013270 [Dactylosporangium darangshiense]|uniref:Uncharacterized protein n=1 Tax=Dactylosporangium darangshiense TaxID=579108 RepID=A0ABP8D028_9ACTN